LKFNIIYADPPWNYTAVDYKHGGRGQEKNQYYTAMRTVDIYSLNIKSIAEKNSILFLWATFPLLPEAIYTMKCWGFLYKTIAFVWIKRTKKGCGYFFGMGNWTRSNAELCLLGVKGKPKRIDASISQLVFSPVREHSRKPDEIKDLILKLVGDLPRIELFARNKTPGWAVWGDEVQCDIELDFRPVGYNN